MTFRPILEVAKEFHSSKFTDWILQLQEHFYYLLSSLINLSVYCKHPEFYKGLPNKRTADKTCSSWSSEVFLSDETETKTKLNEYSTLKTETSH